MSRINIDINGNPAPFINSLNRANASLRTLANGTRNTSAQLNKLNQNFKQSGLAVARLSAGFIGLSGAFRTLRFGITQLAQFEHAMQAVKAITGATNQSFEEMSKEARRLGATTMFTAKQAAEGLKFLAMAGFEAEQATNALEATLQLAQAGMMDLGRAADIASNIMTSFKIAAEDTARVSDVLAQTQASSNTNVTQLGEAFKYAGGVAFGFGLTIEETAAAVGTLSNAGMQASMAGTGLRQTLSRMGAPTRAFKDVMQELGVSMSDLDVPTVGFSHALRTLKDANISASQAMRAFGVRAGNAFIALSNNIGTFDELVAGNEAAEGAASQMADTMKNSLVGAARELQSAFAEVFISSNMLRDGLTTALNVLTEAIRTMFGVGNAASKFREAADSLITTLKFLGKVIIGLGIAKLISMTFGAVIATKALITAETTLAMTSGTATGAMMAQTAATGALGTMSVGASLGVRALNAAMAANPFLLAAAAIATAGTALFAFMGRQDAATKKAKVSADQLKRTITDISGVESDELFKGLAPEVQAIAREAKRLKPREEQDPPEPRDIKEVFQAESEQDLESIKKSLRDEAKALSEASIILNERRLKFKADFGREDEELNQQIKDLEKTGVILSRNIQFVHEQGQAIVDANKRVKEQKRLMEGITAINNENLRITQKATAILEKPEALPVTAQFRKEKLQDSFNKAISDIDTTPPRFALAEYNEQFDKELAKFNQGTESSLDSFARTFGNAALMPNLGDQVEARLQEMIALTGGSERLTDKTIANFRRLAGMQLVGELGLGDLGKSIKEGNELFNALQRIESLRDAQVDIRLTEGFDDGVSQAVRKMAELRMEMEELRVQTEGSEASISAFGRAFAQLNAPDLKDMMLSDGEFTGKELFSRGTNRDAEQILNNFEQAEKKLKEMVETTAVLEDESAEAGRLLGDEITASTGDIEAIAKAAFMAGIRKNASDDMKQKALTLAETITAVQNLFEGKTMSGAALGDKKNEKAEFRGQVLNLQKLITGEMGAQKELVQAIAVGQGEEADAVAKMLKLQQQKIDAQKKLVDLRDRELRDMRELTELMKSAELDASIATGATPEREGQLEKDRRAREKEIEEFKNKFGKEIDEVVDAELKVELDSIRAAFKDSNALEMQKAIDRRRAELREEAEKKFAGTVDRFRAALESKAVGEQIKSAIELASKRLKEAQEKRNKKLDEFRGLMDDDSDDKSGPEAGVSSLAAIGGGGGVGRGGDTQMKILGVNEAMLFQLEKIAVASTGQRFGDFSKEQQDKLGQFANDLKQAFDAGDITGKEAKAALGNAMKLMKEDEATEKADRLKSIRELATFDFTKPEEQAGVKRAAQEATDLAEGTGDIGLMRRTAEELRKKGLTAPAEQLERQADVQLSRNQMASLPPALQNLRLPRFGTDEPQQFAQNQLPPAFMQNNVDPVMPAKADITNRLLAFILQAVGKTPQEPETLAANLR